MDAFNFINFLKNPGYLNQVTFQEINNLIEQYPFCQNLHYLALRKAKNENHKDFVKKLELAATYSPNRQWLYKKLQETTAPLAISDELIAEEDLLDGTEMESVLVVPNIAISEGPDDIVPAPVYKIEETPEPEAETEDPIDPKIEEDIDAMFDELKGESVNDEIPKDFSEEAPPLLEPAEPDNSSSHSVSDNDQIDIRSIETHDDSDLNLENPEDMKLPDDKDIKVIYMEDLVDNVPPQEEESLPEDEPKGKATPIFVPDNPEPELEEEVPQESTSSPAPAIKESTSSDIPFEIYDSRENAEEIQIDPEIPSEAEAPEVEHIIEQIDEALIEEIDVPLNTETPQHLVDNYTDQLDQAASPVDSIENIPLAAMKNEEEKEVNENNTDMDDEKKSTDDLSEDGTQEESPSMAPMPKSAFNSWRKNKDKTLVPSEKLKKEKKKKSIEDKTVDVSDLFKKKKKKKKKSKKKMTKRFAMESLLEHEDVISETLAEILVGQDRKKKAIKMYKRLIKMTPEKEAIYLNRIDELKKED